MLSGGGRRRSYRNTRSPSQGSFSSISGVEDLFMDTKQIYSTQVPSFLEVKPGVEVAQKVAVEEADVAGGRGSQSVLKRVSSFNLMSRLPSQNQLSINSSASMLSLRDSSFLASSDINAPPTETSGDDRLQDRSTTSLQSSASSSAVLKPNWRLRDRMKTVGVALVLALNVGTDPPDIVKPNPCAKLQCWMDPSSVSRAKAATDIAERLQAQYEKWQQQRSARALRYRRLHDPTVEDVRALCLWLRKQARQERVLFHYNGHGVPRPTPNGEIWVFDKNHTEYIPLSVTDLRQWLGKPTIIILDCSSAGVLLPFLTRPMTENSPPNTPQQGSPARASSSSSSMFRDPNRKIDMDTAATNWVKDTIVLCPTSENEGLPMHPDYPADIFTSCLTTPIKIALRWFIRRNEHSMGGIDPESADSIPGQPNDRKTPLGELNWIFTAVTDSIAWDVLPKPLFQRLFRQDLLLASMFRNFLLADRILRSLNCTPQSYPPLPQGVADHPLWQAWDLACETCLFGLIQDGILEPMIPIKKSVHHRHNSSGVPSIPNSPITNSPTIPMTATMPKTMLQPSAAAPKVSASSPFFSEQLRAFEVWLEYASIHKDRLEELESPEQLPVLLQVMLSQVYRIRALELLRRFLALGPWAVNLGLSLGIFPYVMKLLTSSEYKSLLVDIWASILLFDPSCKTDLVKDGAIPHFIQPLTAWSEDDPAASAKQRTFAAFLLAATCHKFPKAQVECIRQSLHGHCCSLTSNYVKLKKQIDDNGYDTLNSQLMPSANREWICICMGNMVQANTIAQQEAYKSNVHTCLISRLKDDDAATVRAASAFALGCLFEHAPDASPPSPLNLGPSSLPPPTFKPQNAGMVPQQLMQPQPGLAQQRMPGGMSSVSSVLSAGLQGGPQGARHQQAISHQLQLQQQQQQLLSPQLQPQMQGRLTPQLQPGAQPSLLSPMGAQGLRLGGQQLSSGVPFLPQQGLFSPQNAGALGGNVLGASTPLSQNRTAMFLGSQQLGGSMQSLLPQFEQQQTTRAVYEDRQRTGLDLTVSEALYQALEDGSALVRHEAVMALCNFVEKYIEAFLVVAEESLEQGSASVTHEQGVAAVPRGFDRVALDRLAICWKRLKALQHRETHPNIAEVAKKLVSLVNEQLMDLRIKANKELSLDEKLHGIEEEEGHSTPDMSARSGQSEHSLLSTPPKVASAGRLASPKTDGPLHRVSSGSSMLLRRMGSSDGMALADRQNSTQSLKSLISTPEMKSEKEKKEYVFPKSTLYAWKVETFRDNIENKEQKELEDLDPLNPAGALVAYQERRNTNALYQARKLARYFENLKPKKPANTKPLPFMDDMDDSEDEEAEAQDLALKNALKLKECKVFRNKGHKMTSMVKFHSYEDVLMVCDDQDSVSFWDYENGNRAVSFKNGNPKNTRMTAAFWINESSRSLFFVGCDDGSARVWDGTLERNGYIATNGPSLLSSFDAAPDIGERPERSGLFCEWQQHSNTLIAGGNSKYIRCWDLETEKCARKIPTNMEDTCVVTSLCTAWDYELEISASGSMGMGPNTVVAGHSDGSLKLWDIRSPTGALPVDARRRTARKDKYTEHSSWIVELSLVSYNGRAELVSGSLDGELRTWDLRMSTSLRSFQVQRGMTALSVHKQIPLVAGGSHNKFIKLSNLEGESLQIIRQYDELHKQKLDPISCVEFHKHKMVLAAGTTDSLVSIYKPRQTPRI